MPSERVHNSRNERRKRNGHSGRFRTSAIFLTLAFCFLVSTSAQQPDEAIQHQSDGNNGISGGGGGARAFAAPIGPNALDSSEQPTAADRNVKTFIKIGGFRNGIQKALLDETQGNPTPPPPDDFDFEQFGRERTFNTYDDNSVVGPRQEAPIWIPPLYRNETEEERAATATTPPPPSTRPPFTTRTFVASELSNRAPIPVRTTPQPQPQQHQFVTQQQFFPQQQQQLPSSLPPQVPQQQRVVVPQQPLFVPQQPQQFVPQQPQQFVPQQPQQFVPQQPQQFVPQRPQQFVPQRPQQFVPQQPPPAPDTQLQTFQQSQQLQPRPPQPQLQQFQLLQPQQPFGVPPQQPQQQSFNAQQQIFQQQQFLRPRRPLPHPTSIQQPPPRQLRPFGSGGATAVNQPPRHDPNTLRSGVCANTIFYESVPAVAFDVHMSYTHFATVVSVDQCARTCHEFNCASALFNPATRHCQFNPSTSFAVPAGTCPNWPNALYQNNVPVGSALLRIFCVTCQRRRRPRPPGSFGGPPSGARRPFTLRTAEHSRFSLTNRVANAAAAALAHGVVIQTPLSAIPERRLEINEKTAALGSAKLSPDDELPFSVAAARTTIAPPLSGGGLRIISLSKSTTLSPRPSRFDDALRELSAAEEADNLRDASADLRQTEDEGAAEDDARIVVDDDATLRQARSKRDSAAATVAGTASTSRASSQILAVYNPPPPRLESVVGSEQPKSGQN